MTTKISGNSVQPAGPQRVVRKGHHQRYGLKQQKLPQTVASNLVLHNGEKHNLLEPAKRDYIRIQSRKIISIDELMIEISIELSLCHYRKPGSTISNQMRMHLVSTYTNVMFSLINSKNVTFSLYFLFSNNRTRNECYQYFWSKRNARISISTAKKNQATTDQPNITMHTHSDI